MMLKKSFEKFCILSAMLILPLIGTSAKQTEPKKLESVQMVKENAQLKEFSSLLLSRLELAKELGIYKWNNKIRIDDQDKENLYFDKISKLAAAQGIDEDLALAFFVSVNDASKDIHIDQFEAWIMSDIHKHKDSPDGYMLEKKIEDIDARLLSSLKDIAPYLETEAGKSKLRDYLSQSLKEKDFSRHVLDSSTRFID